jgi:SAM-dependent methyltransferase
MDIPVAKMYDMDAVPTYMVQCEQSDYTTKLAIPTLHAAWGLSKDPSLKALDLGCGGGLISRSLKEVSGGTVLGVDLCEPMLQLAREIEAKAPQGIQYCQGDCIQDITKLPKVAALMPFDLVNTSWLWAHAKTYEEFRSMARNCFNALRPGGKLFGTLTNPFVTRKDHPFFERYGYFMTADGPEDEIKDGQVVSGQVVTNPKYAPCKLSNYFWTPPTIEKAMREVGFREFKFFPLPYIYKTDNVHEANFYKPATEKPDFRIFIATK